MKSIMMAMPWALGGCLPATIEETDDRRLTPFRQELFEAGKLRDLRVDGHSYAVAVAGRGKPIVLLHGLGGSIYDWRHLLDPLARTRRVIAPDFLGAGESDKPGDEDYSVAAQARRLRGILDRLSVKKATLVGNSYGGGVALRFAQDWPERVDRLVLINSICYADQIPCYVSLAGLPCAETLVGAVPLGKTTRWVIRGSYSTVARLSDAEIDTYIEEIRAEGRRAAIVRTLRHAVPSDTREFEARLKSIRAPALLVWGKDDTTVPVELGRRLEKDLPDARLVELEAGHVPNQEKPAEVLRLINGFLK